MIRVLALTRYDRNGASSRLRTFQYQPYFRDQAVDFNIQSFVDKQALISRYDSGRYSMLGLAKSVLQRLKRIWNRGAYDLLWIEKETIPWLPFIAEKAVLSGKRYVLDYDDATFHNFDLHPMAWVRHVYGRKIDRLMAGATLVVAGNAYLADRARKAGAPWVEILPTVVDYPRYVLRNQEANASTNSTSDNRRKRVVWVGTPYTVKYLIDLTDEFQQLAKQEDFTLRVIGGGPVEMPGVDVECLDWQEATEVERISECDIGIMPLRSTPWEKGKCGYKLIQYMACGLPVVASDIGVNSEIVTDGMNGFLVGSENSWLESLRRLLKDGNLRKQMGTKGEKIVEERFNLETSAIRLAGFLKSAALKNLSNRTSANQ